MPSLDLGFSHRKKYLPCCFLGYYISLNKPGKCFLLHPLLDFSEHLAVP